MKFEIVESSPEAKQEIEIQKAVKYPFDELEIGQSFTASLEDVNFNSLRVSVSKRNLKGDKQFRLIKNSELRLVEVARFE